MATLITVKGNIMSIRSPSARTSLRLLSSQQTSKRVVKRKQFYDELNQDQGENNNGNNNSNNSRHSDRTPAKKIKHDSNSNSNTKRSHKKQPSSNHERNRPSSTSSSTKPRVEKRILQENNNERSRPKTPSKIVKFRDRVKNLKSQKLSPVPDMDPSFFLRCHSDLNRPDDDGNLVWMCRFQPRPLSSEGQPLGTTNLMASCGGKIVCIIDYTSGKVMMRYKDINKDENFYALAWTTLEVSGNRKKGENQPESYFTNILAVAGEAQEIKLLHPSQLVVYASMTGHKKAISSLLFHPENATWLFSGSEDRRIILWDIGIPNFTDYTTKHSQLLVFECDEGILNMVFSNSLGWLLAGTEDGCFGWKMNGAKVVGKSRRPAAKFQMPQLSTNEECVDGLVLLDDHTVACKYVEEPFIYIWNLEEYVPSQVGQSKTFSLKVEPLALLKYINIDEPYVYLSGNKNRLVVGDSEGRIFIYNVKNLRKKNASDQLYIPSRILDWPEVEYPDSEDVEGRPIINTVIVNEEGTHVVATTDDNLICVWKSQDC